LTFAGTSFTTDAVAPVLALAPVEAAVVVALVVDELLLPHPTTPRTAIAASDATRAVLFHILI
jgi:hypothetical protein